MSSNQKTTRRSFIKKTAVTALGFSIIPRHVLGQGFVPPSDQLNVAVIGGGGKGYTDAVNVWGQGVSNIAAICDVDWNMAEEAFYDFPRAKRYKDYRKLLDEMKDIDAITVSTPDHTHAVIAHKAMQMGKHVYVQKPLTHSIHEARVLTEAAERYKIVTQMGNQGASGSGIKQMISWFDAGLIGSVNEVHVWTDRPIWPQGVTTPTAKPRPPYGLDWDNWIGPASYVDYHRLYHPFNWRGWWNFGTGALGDMGCHLIDPPFRVLGLGYPEEVESSVDDIYSRDWAQGHFPDTFPPSSKIQLTFPASEKNPVPVKLTWTDGGLRPLHPDLIPAHHRIGDDDGSNGVIMIGEKGIMTCATYAEDPVIYFNSGEIISERRSDWESSLPEYGHQARWVAACKQGYGGAKHKSLTSSFDFAGPLTESILMGNLAIRSYNLRENRQSSDYPGRKKLLWDGKAMRITNFDPANQFVKRTYRDGWSL